MQELLEQRELCRPNGHAPQLHDNFEAIIAVADHCAGWLSIAAAQDCMSKPYPCMHMLARQAACLVRQTRCI